VKEIVFGAGGVPAKIDPNGLYQVEQMCSTSCRRTVRENIRC
jgi:hypothetical protein